MPRLENWSRMRNKSRVVPSPKSPQIGDLVGGDVFGSPNHKDGTTITTGDVIAIRPGLVITKSSRSEVGTETYELGAWLWDNPEARKSLGDPLIARVFADKDDAEIVLGVGQSVVVRFDGKDASVEVRFQEDLAPEVTVKAPSDEPVRIVHEAASSL